MDAFLESLGTPGPALFAVAGLLALAFLLGEPLVRPARVGGGELRFLALVAGLDLLALVALALGWSGVLGHVPWRWLFGAALVVVLVRAVRALGRGPRPAVPWQALPLVLAGALFGAVALAYPFSWDDLVYQLEVPLRWHAAGGLPVLADNPYSGFPGAFALLNLVLLEEGGILAPALFNAALWLVLALRLLELLGARVGRAGALALTLAFALAWPVVMEALSAYAELFLCLHLLAALPLARELGAGEHPPLRARAALLGLVAGTAAAVKLTGALVPVLAGVAWLSGARRAGPGSARASGAVLVATLLLVAAPFYARPALATGNPLHPYFAGWFGSDEAALAESVYHHAAGTTRFGVPLEPTGRTLGFFLASPVLLALGPLGDLGRFDGLLGLQFLVVLGLLAAWLLAHLRGRARGEPWTWLACAALAYAAWFTTSQQARFLLPASLLAVVAAAQGWPHLARSLRVVCALLLPALALASIPGRTYQHLGLGLETLAGRRSAVDYVESAQGDRYTAACQAILDLTPPEARLCLLFEHRGLYVARAHEIGTPFFQARRFTPSEHVTSSAELLATLQREGFTHVLVGYNPHDPDRMDEYLARTATFQQQLVALRGRGLEILWESREDATGEVRHGLYRVRGP
ncbi:MAG TPA: hypothetical protein VF530_17755 [Planctomycetota bacterium]